MDYCISPTIHTVILIKLCAGDVCEDETLTSSDVLFE